jgi:hypothetical protein
MAFKTVLIYLGKLIVCGVVFSIGVIVGGMIATLMGLSTAPMPENINVSNATMYLFLTSPLLALALVFLARGMAGNFLTRALILSFLAWIAYTVNTQLEAAIFTSMASGFGFSLITFLPACLLSGAAVAWLFPTDNPGTSFIVASKTFFAQRHPVAWTWRLAIATVAFMPIYWVFGLIVVPFTGDYYRQSMYGLQMPTLDKILTVLAIRSVLFLLACLPIIVAWQKSSRSLFLRLGFALFVLVGLLYMIAADWMPISVRLPHTLEILADEFAYAGVLVALLKGRER